MEPGLQAEIKAYYNSSERNKLGSLMNQDLDEWKFYYCSKGKTRDEKKILN